MKLFPGHFEVDDVIFKAGVELTILNYAISVLAKLKQICPSVNLPSRAGPLVAVSRLFKVFGTLHGGFAVWATATNERENSIALVAHENGPRIPGSPAILLARKLLSRGIDKVEAFPCMGFLSLADFSEFLAPYKIFVARGKDGTWTID
jgi:hypothetical protein